jgi:hypothetical protein
LPDDEFLDKFYFDPQLFAPDVQNRSDRSPGSLRITHYTVDTSQLPLHEGSGEGGPIAEPSILYGAHTDYLGFTILRPVICFVAILHHHLLIRFIVLG